MNLTYMRYAVEIAAEGSLNKAAEKLYVGQPNLSRAIKELETSLGVTLFDRTAKGMLLTADGEIFIKHAEAILKQVDDMQSLFSGSENKTMQLSVCVPCAGYISEAVIRFSQKIKKNIRIELKFEESDFSRTIRSLLEGECKIGIIRYRRDNENFVGRLCREKGLRRETVGEFIPVLLTSEASPLAASDHVTEEKLTLFTEIISDPLLSITDTRNKTMTESSRSIRVCSFSSCLGMLTRNPDTFTVNAQLPESVKKNLGIHSAAIPGNGAIFKDVLICRKDYTLTELDKLFITELCNARREAFNDV